MQETGKFFEISGGWMDGNWFNGLSAVPKNVTDLEVSFSQMSFEFFSNIFNWDVWQIHSGLPISQLFNQFGTEIK